MKTCIDYYPDSGFRFSFLILDRIGFVKQAGNELTLLESFPLPGDTQHRHNPRFSVIPNGREES
ncbi:MAG: hypothetical protein B6245_12480 [Desulfobacteraceae bacterium 4572_88]|nr:MAG: hypothetical protein B6245_12480 [Desulfobacteraceae bacterium 4572_88]